MALPKKSELDIYYMITCSRGFFNNGNDETLTLDYLPEVRDKLEWDEHAANDWKTRSVAIAYNHCCDEGILICVPKGTWPLKAIMRLVVDDYVRHGGKMLDDNPLPSGKVLEPVHQAMLSAYLRLWLQKPEEIRANKSRGRWTSVDGWRKVELEVLSVRQLNLMTDTMELTVEDLAQWHCKVMKRTTELALAGKLSNKDYVGC